MAKEIERKFLVRDESWRGGAPGRPYLQGYLSRDPERIVRVRQAGPSAFITIKGVTQGTTRQEFEYPIPLSDAEVLMKLCLRPLIEKTRSIVQYHGKRWEVDEFRGENEGLVLAEIELTREDEPVDLPPWIGEEVSHDARYYNANLVENPFTRWSNK
ncbi:MAG: CYTH domain-containing protein [Terrimicrobiaceae bacterium]